MSPQAWITSPVCTFHFTTGTWDVSIWSLPALGRSGILASCGMLVWMPCSSGLRQSLVPRRQEKIRDLVGFMAIDSPGKTLLYFPSYLFQPDAAICRSYFAWWEVGQLPVSLRSKSKAPKWTGNLSLCHAHFMVSSFVQACTVSIRISDPLPPSNRCVCLYPWLTGLDSWLTFQQNLRDSVFPIYYLPIPLCFPPFPPSFLFFPLPFFFIYMFLNI